MDDTSADQIILSAGISHSQIPIFAAASAIRSRWSLASSARSASFCSVTSRNRESTRTSPPTSNVSAEFSTSRAMVFTYVNPAVAVAAGVAFLSEPFTLTMAVSFALILAGCLLATGSRRGPEPAGGQAAAEDQVRDLV